MASIGNGRCCWVLVPAKAGQEAVFCEKPTGYDMPRDDDGNRHRKYRTFCPEHEVIASKQDEDETRSHEDYGDS